MRITTGRVVQGKVVVEGETLAEGTPVTVVVHEDEDGFDVTPEEEAELLASLEEADQGRTIPGPEFLRDLGRKT